MFHIFGAARRCGLVVSVALVACAATGCGSDTAATAGSGAPETEAVYSYYTGRLEELKADIDGDGTKETVAFMNGTRLERIEVDRNRDGRADRWEYYGPGEVPRAGANPFDRWAVIARAEESSRPDGTITRREFYDHGRIARVEEDTDLDGQVDKWEFYDDGLLQRVDLDLDHRGRATRRLVYDAGGNVTRIEADPSGTGTFVPLTSTP